MKYYSIILFICIGLYTSAQQVAVNQEYILPGVIVDGDTLGLVKLNDIYIFPPLEFKDKDDYLNYRRLVRDVKKVYPYAQIARKTFIEIQLAMETLPEGNKRKKYIKQKEDELLKLYSGELKKFSVRQGRILIKLVDREINMTSYDIIKDLRGSFSAAMWQGVARMFGETLKSEYDPTGEDLLIERIVTMIEQGTL